MGRSAGRSPADPALAKPQSGGDKPYHTLRELLVLNVADRLNLPADSLQIDFKPLDEKVLNLCEPHFKFQIEPTRVRNLGTVEWDVTVITANGNQEVTLSANARAWETQAVLTKPLAYHQLIQEGDVEEKRAMVETLPDNPLVSKSQAVGTQASRDLKPGTVLDGHMLDPVQLVRMGEYVTITVAHGGVSIKTVARAMEAGSLGQTVKVKNETTHDIYDVVVSGPAAGVVEFRHAVPAPGNVAARQLVLAIACGLAPRIFEVNMRIWKLSVLLAATSAPAMAQQATQQQQPPQHAASQKDARQNPEQVTTSSRGKARQNTSELLSSNGGSLLRASLAAQQIPLPPRPAR